MSNSIPEVVTIPTQGARATTGAALYLAILAFPKNSKKGNEFVQALARTVERRKNGNAILRDDSRRIKSAWERIQTRRIPAAAAAFALLPNGMRLGQLRFASTYKNITQLSSEIAKFKITRHTDPNNFLPQVWKNSWPVLHLAMGFLKNTERVLSARKYNPVVALLLDTSWLIPALKSSAMYLLRIPKFVRNFDPNDCILILSEESQPTLDLFRDAIAGKKKIIVLDGTV